jgi:LytTr DNA-binding domain
MFLSRLPATLPDPSPLRMLAPVPPEVAGSRLSIIGPCRCFAKAECTKRRQQFVNSFTMQFALRKARHLGRWRRELAVLLTIGIILAWLGPYGTYVCLDLSERFAFWMLRSLLVGTICLAAFELVSAIGPGASWPPLKRGLASVVLASLPCALIGFALAVLNRHAPASPLQLADVYGRMAVVTAVVGVPLLLLRTPAAREGASAARTVSAAMPGRPNFLRRVPARLGTELLYIEVEDHYLRVHTNLGSDLVLLRLSDAVGELDPAIGWQVHRSYWVCRRAVARVERNGHRTWLVLTSGARVPVSRTYLPALRAAGWL